MASPVEHSLLARVVPGGTVRCVEEFVDPNDESREPLDWSAGLFPPERAAVLRAAPERQMQFAAGRRCARAALQGLVPEPPAIPVGAKREPIWPPGIVGSITHCRGYRAAAVARARELSGIGIDAEPHGPLPDGVVDVVTDAAERSALRRLARAHPEVQWAGVLFSAKESLYKALFPLTRRWIDFTDVVVTCDPGAGHFTARPVPSVLAGTPLAPQQEIRGRFAVHDGLIVTSVLIAPSTRPPAHSGRRASR